jgi:hypothetical protein
MWLAGLTTEGHLGGSRFKNQGSRICRIAIRFHAEENSRRAEVSLSASFCIIIIIVFFICSLLEQKVWLHVPELQKSCDKSDLKELKVKHVNLYSGESRQGRSYTDRFTVWRTMHV